MCMSLSLTNALWLTTAQNTLCLPQRMGPMHVLTAQTRVITGYNALVEVLLCFKYLGVDTDTVCSKW